MPTDLPQGNGTPEVSHGESESPKYITEEQLNRAITARFKGLEKKFETSLSEFGTGFASKFEELVAAKFESISPPKEKSASSSSVEEDPKFRGVMKQLEELKVQTQKAQQERDTERAKAREVSLRQRVQDELAKHGIDTSRSRHALALLVDAEKRVSYSPDSDDIVFRDSDNTEVDLTTGLKSWIKSDDGKLYMPPRGVSGSGDRQGQAKTKANSNTNIYEELGGMLLQNYHGYNAKGT